MTILGSGYTPGDTIDIDGDHVFVETTTIGADGSFVAQAPVPRLGFIAPGQKRYTVKAISKATGAALASTSFLVARATKRYGRARGPCGTLSTRTQRYPGGRPQFGLYRVQYDASRSYGEPTRPRLVTRLRIFRTSHL
jgi:hypothetical protein